MQITDFSPSGIPLCLRLKFKGNLNNGIFVSPSSWNNMNGIPYVSRAPFFHVKRRYLWLQQWQQKVYVARHILANRRTYSSSTIITISNLKCWFQYNTRKNTKWSSTESINLTMINSQWLVSLDNVLYRFYIISLRQQRYFIP